MALFMYDSMSDGWDDTRLALIYEDFGVLQFAFKAGLDDGRIGAAAPTRPLRLEPHSEAGARGGGGFAVGTQKLPPDSSENEPLPSGSTVQVPGGLVGLRELAIPLFQAPLPVRLLLPAIQRTILCVGL